MCVCVSVCLSALVSSNTYVLFKYVYFVAERTELNTLKSRTHCARVAEEEWEKSGLEHKLGAYTSTEEMHRDREQLVALYMKRAVGPAKHDVIRFVLFSLSLSPILLSFFQPPPPHATSTHTLVFISKSCVL